MRERIACTPCRNPSRKEALEAQAKATVCQTLKQVVVDSPHPSATAPYPSWTAHDAVQPPSPPGTTAGLMHGIGTEGPPGGGNGGVAGDMTEGSGGSGGVGARGGGVTGGRRSEDRVEEGRSPVGRCLNVRTVFPKSDIAERNWHSWPTTNHTASECMRRVAFASDQSLPWANSCCWSSTSVPHSSGAIAADGD